MTQPADLCTTHNVPKVFLDGYYLVTGDPYLECPQGRLKCSKTRITKANAHLFPEEVSTRWQAGTKLR
jgi:hypothetical protein